MSIDFFNLLDDAGWVPLAFDPSDPQHFWIDGRPLSDAPIDAAATFDGAMWASTKFAPAFGLQGLRCRPNFTIPRHHRSLRQLIIVFGGSFSVEVGGAPGIARREVGPGQFLVTSPGMPLSMTAGPEGVTYIETASQPTGRLATYWHAEGWVA